MTPLHEHINQVFSDLAFGKELSVIEEIPSQDFGYAENEMTVGNSLEYFFTQPFPKFHYPLLMT
jgi:hypothetical protein